MPGTRRSSLVGAVLLVALGLLFLYSQLSSGPGSVAAAVSLLACAADFPGTGKVWDHLRPRRCFADRGAWLSGGEIAVILLLIIAGIALSLQTPAARIHDVETIDRQGSEPVHVHIQMPAGEMKLSGGAGKLMEADFNYDEAEGKPEVSYHVSGGAGQLDVTQPGKKFHIGPTRNNWNLRLANEVPMELKVEMGAGRSDLKVGELVAHQARNQYGRRSGHDRPHRQLEKGS